MSMNTPQQKPSEPPQGNNIQPMPKTKKRPSPPSQPVDPASIPWPAVPDKIEPTPKSQSQSHSHSHSQSDTNTNTNNMGSSAFGFDLSGGDNNEHNNDQTVTKGGSGSAFGFDLSGSGNNNDAQNEGENPGK